MSKDDQYHCLRVLKISRKLARGKKIDLSTLEKASLLHDVGKDDGELTIFFKVICVLMDVFLKNTARKLAAFNAPKGSLKKALYIYYNHAKIGAEKIRKHTRNEKVAFLVENHHMEKSYKDSEELKILKCSDDMN